MPSGSITLPVNTIELTPHQAREWNARMEAEAIASQKHPNSFLVAKAWAAMPKNVTLWEAQRTYFRHAYLGLVGFAVKQSLIDYINRIDRAKTAAEWQAAAFTEAAE